MSYRILIVDDDEILRESLREQLEENSYVVQEAGDVKTGIECLKNSWCDAVLLDVGLPDMDGREGCKKMREAGINVPIIMLTAHDTEKDVVSGFDSGGSDYITKPFRLGELLARLQSQLRQYEKREDVSYVIGPYLFQPGLKRLTHEKNAKRVSLTDKETSLLKILYRGADEIVGKETLLSEVWGYDRNMTTHTLETHIYRLRGKLEYDAEGVRFLETIQGGYRLHRRGIGKKQAE